MIILFDLDGTLIDSTEAILESFHNSYNVHKEKHPSDEDIKELIGHPLDVMFKELGIDETKVWEFVTTYKEHYREISTLKTLLLPHAKEAIEAASKIAELGIVTTKTGKYSQVLMEHFGLMDYFKVLIGREHVENPKPHEEPILKALESFDVENHNNIWMIGDTEMDLIAAKNAKINSVGVTCGYGTADALKVHTEHICKNSLEAIMYLKDTQ